MASIFGFSLLIAILLGGAYLYWKADQLDRRIERQRGAEPTAGHEEQ